MGVSSTCATVTLVDKTWVACSNIRAMGSSWSVRSLWYLWTPWCRPHILSFPLIFIYLVSVFMHKVALCKLWEIYIPNLLNKVWQLGLITLYLVDVDHLIWFQILNDYKYWVKILKLVKLILTFSEVLLHCIIVEDWILRALLTTLIVDLDILWDIWDQLSPLLVRDLLSVATLVSTWVLTRSWELDERTFRLCILCLLYLLLLLQILRYSLSEICLRVAIELRFLFISFPFGAFKGICHQGLLVVMMLEERVLEL